MAIDYEALKDELEQDPKNLGYSALISAGRDLALAALLNAKSGAGAETLSLQVITKGAFLLGISPVGLTLPTKSSADQMKWDRIISFASAADFVDVGNANVAGLLALAIADGLITQQQVDSFTKRVGSRAEVLFGADTVINHEDIAKALR